MTIAPLPALTLAASAALFAWELRKAMLGRASLRWTRTEGLVTDARFDETTNRDSDGFNDSDIIYSAHLEFVYTVNGRRYRSSRFTYRPTRSLDQTYAYGLLQGMHRGKVIEVYYDPERPERAVAIPGMDRNNLVMLALWCGAMLAVVYWAMSA